jgi:hypothetical protein
MADDCGPFAACVAAALSPTIPDAMICPRPDSLVPSDDTDVDSISCGPFAANAVVLEEEAFCLLISELEGCEVQSEKLHCKEAPPSKKKYSGFHLSIEQCVHEQQHEQLEVEPHKEHVDLTVETDQTLPVVSAKDGATAVAIEQPLASKKAFCACAFNFLPVAVPVNKCGRYIQRGQKLNSDEALPSMDANSAFNISCVRHFAVLRKPDSAAFMPPPVLFLIVATQCIVLAVNDCDVLSDCHSGCDPPLRDHYFKSSVRRTNRSGSLTYPSFIYCLPAVLKLCVN